MNYKKAFISVLAASVMGACSFFGKHNVDIAPYSIIKAENSFEIREYKSLIVAKTTVNGSYKDMSSIAFNRLFKYISGDNQKQSKIAMTAPVLQSQGEKISMTAPVFIDNTDNKWTMAFVLPTSYSLETAPKPLNPDITIEEVKKHQAAVLVFSGLLNPRTISEKSNQLQEWLSKNKYRSLSAPTVAGYDPPWTIPLFRRNEVQIVVE